MAAAKFEECFTFSDVSLIPLYSQVLPREIDVSIELGKKLKLKAPILSAAMDTVTTAPMAIAMAQVGGLGVIHKNMTIGDQALEVRKVKKYEAWVITNPVTIEAHKTIAHAENLVREESVSGFPVVSKEGKLLGMLTARDMLLADNKEQLVSDLMSTDLVKAKADISTRDCLLLMKQRRIEKLPLVDEQNNLVGLVTIKDLHQVRTWPDAVRDERGRLYCAAAVGVGPDLEERAHALVDAGADALVLDSAHGHSANIALALKNLRSWYKDILLIAGNIVTAEGAIFLYEAGADVVKVGVGPGSICTTRVVAGVGIPQLSAIMSVGSAAKERGFQVIADGGLQFSGDITKALAGGAHAVMTGSLLAGAQEAPGERLISGGKEYKVYRGMGSLSAMKKGSSERYGQNTIKDGKLVPEGVEGRTPFRGTLGDIVFQLVGGLRAGMGYVGARNIADLQEKARFVRLSAAGLRESHVHDINITNEAPNYCLQG